ncbi:MAG: sulfatase activating formylglycine-generating enzyme, partial [Myxococcota bacterium]
PHCVDGYSATVAAAGGGSQAAFEATAEGVLHLAGNVSEWVEDCYETAGYEDAPSDGTANTWDGCSHRVTRGGNYDSLGRDIRGAERLPQVPTYNGKGVGFRCAWSPQ